jgi:hypothetical protein
LSQFCISSLSFIELEEIADFWVFLFALCISVSCFGFVNLVFLECCPYVIAMVAIWQGPRSFVFCYTFNLSWIHSTLVSIAILLQKWIWVNAIDFRYLVRFSEIWWWHVLCFSMMIMMIMISFEVISLIKKST